MPGWAMVTLEETGEAGLCLGFLEPAEGTTDGHIT